jgi:hypothetical protein
MRSTASLTRVSRIHYSDRYSDDEYEYRHVILPKQLLKMIPKDYFSPEDNGVLRLLSEQEWRGIGITQSLGWEHYEVHGVFLRAAAWGLPFSPVLQLRNPMSCSSDVSRTTFLRRTTQHSQAVTSRRLSSLVANKRRL